jgi:hypothetical protein
VFLSQRFKVPVYRNSAAKCDFRGYNAARLRSKMIRRIYYLIFSDVEMPRLHGEGSMTAFRRLKEEIEKLNKCLLDLHSTDPRDDKKRIEGVRGRLTREFVPLDPR